MGRGRGQNEKNNGGKVQQKPQKRAVEEEEEFGEEEMDMDVEGLEEQDLEDGVEEGGFSDLEQGDMEGLEEGEEGPEGADEQGEGEDGEFPSHKGPMIPAIQFQDDVDQIPVDETLAETDTQLLRMKINSHLKVLSNFKENRDPEKPRSEYIAELKEYYCQLYNYNKELMEIFFNLFSPHEVCLPF